MKYIWACSCGLETECESADFAAGAVWHCVQCDKMFGCVRTKLGPKVWITIDPSEAEFHRIFDVNSEEDEE